MISITEMNNVTVYARRSVLTSVALILVPEASQNEGHIGPRGFSKEKYALHVGLLRNEWPMCDIVLGSKRPFKDAQYVSV